MSHRYLTPAGCSGTEAPGFLDASDQFWYTSMRSLPETDSDSDLTINAHQTGQRLALPGLRDDESKRDPRGTSLLGSRVLSLGRNAAVAALHKQSLGGW